MLIVILLIVLVAMAIFKLIIQVVGESVEAAKSKAENNKQYEEALCYWERAVKKYSVDTTNPIVYEKYIGSADFHPIYVWRDENNTLTRFHAKPSKNDFLILKSDFLFLENLKPKKTLTNIKNIHRTIQNGFKMTVVDWEEGTTYFRGEDYEKLISLFPEFK